jgi:hypothetical protein
MQLQILYVDHQSKYTLGTTKQVAFLKTSNGFIRTVVSTV